MTVILLCILILVGFRYLSPLNANHLASLIEANFKSFSLATLLSSQVTSTRINSSSNSASTSSDSSPSTHITQGVSYVLLDPKANQILKSQNADLHRAPASTLKLLTGLIAEDNLKETDIIRVGKEVNVEGSKLGLSPGDEISVQNLLTALYVHSANDAAAALAVKISGSIPEFAQKMNNYASSTLGCQDSHFTNPHGLPDPDQYTTAKDLSIIANHFIQNEKLMNYVQKTTAQVHWKDARSKSHNANLQNTNLLLGVYPGDSGLKTGTTTEAGQCLVSYVKRPDGELLLVLLGSDQRYKDSITLLDEAWAEQRSAAALRGLSKDPKSLISSPGIF